MANRSAFRKPLSRSYSKRKVATEDPRERFLIVCEGEKTEPNYFRSFRVPKEVVAIKIEGLGYNTVRLVKEAIELKEDDDYDQVWCVLDRNSHPADHFNSALALAQNNGVKVAYSNQSFELWYLLHFHYCDTALHRTVCIEKLSELLGYKYEKNSRIIYNALESQQQTAIRNAERLLAQYSPPNPERDNPSTTVHLLVQQLNRFVR